MKPDYGRAIRIAKAARGFTQKDLCERSGVVQMSISRFERGERAPNFAVLNQICDALGISVLSMVALAEGETDLGPRIMRELLTDPKPMASGGTSATPVSFGFQSTNTGI